MNLGIIGYAGHAARLIPILDDMDGVRLRAIFCRDTTNCQDARATPDLNTLLGLDGVIISTPTASHEAYLDLLLNRSQAFVFCEKPLGISRKTLARFSQNEALRRRLFVNYNFAFSGLADRMIRDLHGGGRLPPAYISIIFSSPAAARFAPDNWRIATPMGIVDTVASHAISFLLRIFPRLDFIGGWPSRILGQGFDSAALRFRHEACAIDIFCTWACPPRIACTIHSTAGHIIYDDPMYAIQPSDGAATAMAEQLPYADNYRRSLISQLHLFRNGISGDGDFRASADLALRTEAVLWDVRSSWA